MQASEKKKKPFFLVCSNWVSMQKNRIVYSEKCCAFPFTVNSQALRKAIGAGIGQLPT